MTNRCMRCGKKMKDNQSKYCLECLVELGKVKEEEKKENDML